MITNKQIIYVPCTTDGGNPVLLELLDSKCVRAFKINIKMTNVVHYSINDKSASEGSSIVSRLQRQLKKMHAMDPR